jgi:hypothetical protein
MKHVTRLIGAALMAALVALPAMAQDAPKITVVRGVVQDTTATTLVVQGRAPRGGGDAPAPVTVTVNGATVYAAGARGALTDVVANALVAVAPDAEGDNANAKGIVVYSPAKASDNALVAVAVSGRMVQMMANRGAGGGGGGQGNNGPKLIIGTVTAVDGAKVTIKTKDATLNVTTSDQTMVQKLSDKAMTDLVKGTTNVSVAATNDDAKTALAVIIQAPRRPRNNAN